MSPCMRFSAWMRSSVGCGAEAASFCRNDREFCPALDLISDTMVMVSVFAFLGGTELVLATALLLVGVQLIILARMSRAKAPKRELLVP